MVVIGLLAGLMVLSRLWHTWTLPEGEPSALHGGGMAGAWKALDETWITFFQKKSIWMMLLVVFMYRFGEGFIERFGPLFLMDPRAVGGMGFNNQAIGSIYNTYGTIASSPVRWWADCLRRSSRSGDLSSSWPSRSTSRTSPITTLSHAMPNTWPWSQPS